MKNAKHQSISSAAHNTPIKNKKSILIISLIILVIFNIIVTRMFTSVVNKNEPIVEVEETKIQASVDASTWDTSKVTIVTDTSMGYEVSVPIPKGYVMSNVTGETEVKTGLVIYEGEEAVTDSNKDTAQKTRNQWVWVPVNASEMYGTDENGKKWGKLYRFYSSRVSNNNWSEENGIMRINSLTGYRESDIVRDYDTDNYLTRYTNEYKTGHELLRDIETEFENIVESVEKYGGFYIGRYETGNLSQEIPSIVKGNIDIGGKTWYTLYEKCKKIDEENKNVRTSMIYGSQWDATLKYLIESESKTYEEITDSRSWGNYNNSTFEYINTSGSTVTKSENSSVRIPSGSSEYTKSNNIYDLAGNVDEKTIEVYNSSYRVSRGGGYNFSGSGFSVDVRMDESAYKPISGFVNSGCRIVLYIK